jgi:hypothetical protein
VLGVLDALLLQMPELAAQEPFSKVLAFAKRPRTPMLIEAHNVPVAFLRAEQGGPCGRVLESIQSALNDPAVPYDLMVQQENFELLCPIPASQLHFYKIVSPRPGDYDFLEDVQLDSL